MMRNLLACLLISSTCVLGAPPKTQTKRKTACATPQNIRSCYWTRGRLSLYDGGAPRFRLWKIGTRRLLGVYGGPSDMSPDRDQNEDSPSLPSNLDFDFTTVSVYADFEVCPLTAEKDGAMQAVCIEAAKNVTTGEMRMSEPKPAAK